MIEPRVRIVAVRCPSCGLSEPGKDGPIVRASSLRRIWRCADCNGPYRQLVFSVVEVQS